MFAGLRCMIDGSDDVIEHSPDGALHPFSWFWGFLSGFCRINPACFVMMSTCAVSLALWSKHRYPVYMPPPRRPRDTAIRFAAIHKSQSASTLVGDKEDKSSSNHQRISIASSAINLPAVAEREEDRQFLVDSGKGSGVGRSRVGHAGKWYHSLVRVTFLLALLTTLCVLVFGMTCSIFPGWIWHFSAYFFYNVPSMDNVRRAMHGVCPSYGGDMCLSNDAWLLLSNGLLSKYKRKDVEAVARGVNVAQNGGLIINIMARDTAKAIPALVKNVEALSPFYGGKLAVVVYENDSVDGTRQKFKDWSKSAKGYKVDLITCEDEGDADCRLQETHRYDQHGDKMSAVGRMADYRNKILDYITERYDPQDYTHMMVADVDLAVSWAPLGLMHSLGTIGEHAPVAVRGIMMIPGALGSLYSPYDYSAFRPKVNEDNSRLRGLHDWFCGLAPPGSRWRNNCDVMSPFNMMHVLSLDTEFVSDPYPIRSGFNGAVMYPYRQVLQTKARYDDGDDGQRCEHIGFNDALCDESNWDPDDADNGKFATSMFVSPKWTIHLDPSRPGGPTGFRFASLIATQGINAQCGIMFSTVFVCNWLLAGFVAMAITGLVRGWEKFIRTDLFRKWAVFAGVNLADVVPGGLAVARKNTADDEGVLLMSLGSDGNESDSDSDEEAGFIRRDVKSHII